MEKDSIGLSWHHSKLLFHVRQLLDQCLAFPRKTKKKCRGII
jgi:hypothetical protein